jgi:hypothetical protein
MTDHPPGALLRAIVGMLDAFGIPYMVVPPAERQVLLP